MNWRLLVAPGSALYLLPLAALIGLALLRQPDARAPVLRWWSAVAVACLLTAASKIAFYGWGTGIREWDLTCFSGHAVLSLAVWPVALALPVPPRRRAWRALAAAAGVAIALLIGYSRIPLRAHPPSEVVAGVLLGGMAAAYGLRALRGCHLAPGPALLAAGLLATFLLLGPRVAPVLPSERWFARIGVALSGHEKPVSRRHWRNVVPASSAGLKTCKDSCRGRSSNK